MELRKDGWDTDADLYLAQTVLKHIESGSTQLKAFEEASEILKRTSAACGFRWNGAVRKKYEQAIEKAKMVRLQNKNQGKVVSINESKNSLLEISKDPRAVGDLIKEETFDNEAAIPLQLDQEILKVYNEAMDQVSNNMKILRQIIVELAGRLQTANDLNLNLQSEYTNLQNEIINAVDMKVFLRIAGKVEAEQITG
ncbi:hypothetical protein [Paenibacillus sp. 276b]|uniref:hypothetical protein n=1 Tax=Paenibacillus sp. 276b TaxID=1566277 RepID=UPI000896D187|nr:hypothetical protein [Paenibacillus sp. 276b]SEB27643.1 prespore-specific regulator [Paenibacillus sp. 276b]